MDYKTTLAQAFDEVITEFNNCTGMRRFWGNQLENKHYASFLRETFHYTRENPQIQAMATVFFRGDQRDAVKPFLRHAISEVGHDQLALNDMAALGFDNTGINAQMPLPATTALVAFPYYQIYNINSVGYLGYLYFLEFMPTTFGADYLNVLTNMGVPPEAMSFLQDHTTIDVGHTQAMSGYVDALVRNEDDLKAVIYSMKVTGELYSNFVTAAFKDADSRKLYGHNPAEIGPIAEVAA